MRWNFGHGRRFSLPRAAIALGVALLAFSAAPAGAAPDDPGVMAAGVPSSFAFEGYGWGHGVGLSQYGAYGQAKEGRSATQIVQHYFPAAVLTAKADAGDIRVNVGRTLGTARLRAVALGAAKGTWTLSLGGVRRVFPVGEALSFIRSGGAVVAASAAGVPIATGPLAVIHWSGSRNPGLNSTAPTAMEVAKSASGGFASDRRYRYGTIDVAVADSGLQIVNSLRIHDEYLNGIAEVSAGWPLAAQGAQAIAARSYALSAQRILRPACRCHVDDGYGGYYDQTFWGFAREQGPLGSSWAAAVKSTTGGPASGLALTYGGLPIPAFYTSSTGGRTQNSEDVWGGYLPWARSVDDHWSAEAQYHPKGKWVPVTASQGQVAAAFGLPNVATLSVSRFVSGAVREVVARTSSGARSRLTGSQVRARLGLRSTYISRITPPGGAPALPSGGTPLPGPTPTPPPVPGPPPVPSRTISVVTPWAKAVYRAPAGSTYRPVLRVSPGTGRTVALQFYDRAGQVWRIRSLLKTDSAGLVALAIPYLRGSLQWRLYVTESATAQRAANLPAVFVGY